jgi:predicted site-specific integrase-resolvase
MAHGETEENSKACLIYCRVSTSQQSSLKFKDGTAKDGSDLQRQVERMKVEASSRYPELPCRVYQEQGSGMNYDRKVLNKLLDEVLAGRWDNSVLLVENKDRLVRFAEPLVAKILRSKGIEIIYTAQEEVTDDEDFTADILAVIHFFSARHYSKRVAERRRKVLPPEAIQRGKELIDQGMNVRDIQKRLEKEGIRAEDGSLIGYNILRRNIFHKQAIIEQAVERKESSAEEWKRQFVGKASSCYCLSVIDAHAEYEQWAIVQGKPVVSKRKFALLFGPSEQIYHDKKLVSGWRGVVVKGRATHFISETKKSVNRSPLDALLEFTNQVRKDEPLNQVFKRYKSFCKEKNVAQLSKLRLTEAVRTVVL